MPAWKALQSRRGIAGSFKWESAFQGSQLSGNHCRNFGSQGVAGEVWGGEAEGKRLLFQEFLHSSSNQSLRAGLGLLVWRSKALPRHSLWSAGRLQSLRMTAPCVPRIHQCLSRSPQPHHGSLKCGLTLGPHAVTQNSACSIY